MILGNSISYGADHISVKKANSIAKLLWRQCKYTICRPVNTCRCKLKYSTLSKSWHESTKVSNPLKHIWQPWFAGYTCVSVHVWTLLPGKTWIPKICIYRPFLGLLYGVYAMLYLYNCDLTGSWTYGNEVMCSFAFCLLYVGSLSDIKMEKLGTNMVTLR